MQGLLIKKLRSFFGFPSKYKKRNEPSVKLDKPGPGSYLDSLSHGPLGVEVTRGKMLVLIPENSKITKKERNLYTVVDNQSGMRLDVYEGASSLTRENIRLGEFKLVGIPPSPKGVGKIKVCFDIDTNGTLKVSAVDAISSDLKNEIIITSDQRQSAKMLNAKTKLQKYARDIKHTLNDARYKGKLKASNIEKVMKAANEVVEWLNMNQSAKVDEYKSKQKELEGLWNPIVTKLYQDAAGGPLKPKSRSPALPKAGSEDAAGGPMKPESRSPAIPKAGSVLDDVD